MRHFSIPWGSQFISPHLLTLLGFLLALLLFSHLILQRRSPSSTFAWILLILFIPYLGVPLYFMFGGRKIRRLLASKGTLYPPHPPRAVSHPIQPLTGAGLAAETQRILVASGGPSVTEGNAISLLSEGEEAYQTLCDLIDGAKHSIHMNTFIFGKDDVARSLKDRLVQRAQEGIEVRLLLDGIGSFWFPRKWIRELRRSGAKVAIFMPFIHVPFQGYSNLRNHRKIYLFDNQIAVVGGMNLAQEYMGPQKDPKRWHDLALKIQGKAVVDLRAILDADWRFASGDKKPSVNSSPVPSEETGREAVQVVASGPDVATDPLYDAFLFETFNARDRIWIATPYFIPDESLSRGLELAAKRGVDVRILVPAHSNHPLADLCRGTYLREIVKAGARISLYPRMMHAKASLFDDHCAVVASANLDIRSLFLNFEIGLFLYSKEAIEETALWFSTLEKHSTHQLPNVSRPKQLVEAASRLLSPLL